MALSKNTRLAIVTSMVAVFCILAPLLILYARGYRYDFKKQEVHKVGMIMIAHDPVTATSTLEGHPPAFDITAFGYERFIDLEAGTYEVKVERDGYHPWNKKLEVFPEIVTWARYVTLFRQDPELTDLVTLDEIQAVDFSPNREWLVVIGTDAGEQKAVFYSVKNNKLAREIPLRDLGLKPGTKFQNQTIVFGPDSTQALLSWQDENENWYHGIISRAIETEPILLKNLPLKLSQVKWHPDTPSLLYGLDDRSDLYRLSVNAGQVTPRKIAGQVLAFQPSAGGLYLIRGNLSLETKQKNTLTRLDLDGSGPEIISEDIEAAASYDLAISLHRKIAVRTEAGALYVITPEQTERVALNVAKMDWSLDNDQEESTDEQLLYFNQHEIYVYDPTIKNSESITRYTETIDNAIWYNGNYKYLIFTVGQKVKIIELDERDHRNVVDFWQASPDEQITPQTLFIDNDAENIFLTSAWQEKMSLKKLTIRK